jgi:hypothetical protein
VVPALVVVECGVGARGQGIGRFARAEFGDAGADADDTVAQARGDEARAVAADGGAGGVLGGLGEDGGELVLEY